MEKLYELHDETDFDLVVVDTPPTRNALDFLDAPRRLTRFLDHRLYRVLMAPTRGVVKAVNVAAQAFLRTVSQGRRRRGGRRRHRLLPGLRGHGGGLPGAGRRGSTSCWPTDGTAFVLVASPRRDTVEEARFFAERAGRGRHRRCGASSSTGCTRGSATGWPRRRARAGRARWPAPTSAALYAQPRRLPGWSPSREDDHLAGLAERGGAGAGGPGAVPAHRRARPRRPRRGRPTHLFAAGAADAPVRAGASGAGRSAGRLLLVERGGRVVEGGGRRLDGLGDRDDAVEAGGVQQAGERGPAAGDGDVAAGLAGPADAADERAEAGRVHERHRRQVDEQAALRRPARRAPRGTARRCRRRARRRAADGVVVASSRPGCRATASSSRDRRAMRSGGALGGPSARRRHARASAAPIAAGTHWSRP